MAKSDTATKWLSLILKPVGDNTQLSPLNTLSSTAPVNELYRDEVFEIGGYKIILGQAKQGTKVWPRFYWKSNSTGWWRAGTGIEFTAQEIEENGQFYRIYHDRYIKGNEQNKHGLYCYETVVPDSVFNQLEDIYDSKPPVKYRNWSDLVFNNGGTTSTLRGQIRGYLHNTMPAGYIAEVRYVQATKWDWVTDVFGSQLRQVTDGVWGSVDVQKASLDATDKLTHNTDLRNLFKTGLATDLSDLTSYSFLYDVLQEMVDVYKVEIQDENKAKYIVEVAVGRKTHEFVISNNFSHGLFEAKRVWVKDIYLADEGNISSFNSRAAVPTDVSVLVQKPVDYQQQVLDREQRLTISPKITSSHYKDLSMKNRFNNPFVLEFCKKYKLQMKQTKLLTMDTKEIISID